MRLKPVLPDLMLWPLVMLLSHSFPALAGGFAATVSPPRFELHSTPGETVQEIVDIYNADSNPASFDIRTADWDLSEDGNVTIHPPELQADSCRPWMRIERRNISLPAEGTRRFRFQVNVPADAPVQECRVALLLEGTGEDSVMAGGKEIRFPVQGRIAIIIYVAVGDAQPKLEIVDFSMQEKNGVLLPIVKIRNNGNAHGRPSGILEGTDALGQHFEFTVSPSPVMPGQQRRIPLWPDKSASAEQDHEITSPLKLKGTIEWEGGKFDVDTAVSPTHHIGLAGN